MRVLITMFQGNAVLSSPQPRPSAWHNILLSKGLFIRAPGDPLGILDTPSNGTPISKEDELSNDSEVLDLSQLPLLGTAAHMYEDPEAYDTNLPGQSARISSGDVKDIWLQETIHMDVLKTHAEFVKCL